MIIRSLFTLLLFMTSMVMLHAQGTAAGGWFSLKGTLTGRDTGIIRLEYEDYSGQYKKDSTVVRSGHFLFKGRLSGPVPAWLVGNVRSNSVEDPNRKALFLEPEHLEVRLAEGQFQHALVTGSRTQDELEKVNALMTPMHEAIANLKKERAGIGKDDTSTAAKQLRTALDSRFDSLLKLKYRIKYTFIGGHPDSYLSPYLLIGYRNDEVSLDSARKLYDNFSRPVKQSRSGIYVRDAILAQENAIVSHPAPDFKRKDINGRWISCSSFKGEKYVLLDFWYSGCASCRELSPHLRDLYSKYHDKGLEIISISCDIDAGAWKKAIVKDSTGRWIHIGGYLNEKYNKREIESQYSVSAWPCLVLIDKKGFIVGRYAGGEDAPVSDLDDLLKGVL